MSNARFPKDVRLRSSLEFRRVFDHKRSVSDQSLVVYAAPNDIGSLRLGMSVSRKVGNAVVRNEWKRQIREAFRLQQTKLPGGMDLIVLPRRGASPEHHQICKSLAVLAKKLARQLEQRPGRSP